MKGKIQTEREGRVLTVRVLNPPQNFIDAEIVAGLRELVANLEDDGSIGAVVITGGVEGKFVTHYDIDEILEGAEGLGLQVGPRLARASLALGAVLDRIPGLGSRLRRGPIAGVFALRDIHDLFERMTRLDKVFIAAIGGPAMGGGCELALACDIRLIGESAGPIGLPEMTLGLQPGAGGTQRMAHAIGPARALEMVLEGRALAPQEAVEIGLVSRVVPDAELIGRAQELGARMARRTPGSVIGAKRSIYVGATAPLGAGLAIERLSFLASGSSASAKRGLRAYAAQVAAAGRAPWAEEDLIGAWQEGTVVDLNDGGRPAKGSPVRRAYDATYGRLFAALYDRGLAKAERGELGERRAAVVGGAAGRTLELGAGTGLNLRHYPEAVTELVLTEPFAPMAGRLRRRLAGEGRDARVVEAPAERLPFPDDSFDTVVSTLVLCTVEDPTRTLSEVRRVLRPGGSLLFIEHVRAESPGLARAQNALHGPWFAIGHGCHCNRDTAAAIAASGLEAEPAALAQFRMRGLAPIVAPVIAGAARAA